MKALLNLLGLAGVGLVITGVGGMGTYQPHPHPTFGDLWGVWLFIGGLVLLHWWWRGEKLWMRWRLRAEAWRYGRDKKSER